MINIDGTVAVIAMNPTKEKIDYKIYIENKGIDLSLPAHAISTITFK
jgi:hypothetical protein